MKLKFEEEKELGEKIHGYYTPHIYAFETHTVPNYLKVGDTYRPVYIRMGEWRQILHDNEIKRLYEEEAKVNDDVFFRDYAVHKYLIDTAGMHRLTKEDVQDPSNNITQKYFSKEFFRITESKDVEAAIKNIEEGIKDIKKSYGNSEGRYGYYTFSKDGKPTGVDESFSRDEKPKPLRGNQEAAIERFKEEVLDGNGNVKEGKRKLLMYAVMRFGKTFTSLCCAKEMKARLVVVLSGKKDVGLEWKEETESEYRLGSHNDGEKEYIFLSGDNLREDEEPGKNILEEKLKTHNVVLFLTLQDLAGDSVKEKHRNLFKTDVDLLIVDETHFAARSPKLGRVLLEDGSTMDEKNLKKDEKKFFNLSEGLDDDSDLEDGNITVLNDSIEKNLAHAKVTLHLSGTPYRILMSSEFKDEDIIARVQYSDIYNAMQKWYQDNAEKKERPTEAQQGEEWQKEEWENPYFGFPQMIRFAYVPNTAAKEKIKELKKDGAHASLSKLFDAKRSGFVHENEVLDLLLAIDGGKEDDNVFPFLDYDKIKEGRMCRHMVMVLPLCASCDAMKRLLKNHEKEFKHLGSYKIINISSSNKRRPSIGEVKSDIKEADENGEKTISLTVYRMLTGCTVPEWDTMIFLRDSQSPQEYDQATFRIQSPHIRVLKGKDENGSETVIKENLKPQTLLVDFLPERMFRLEEQRAFVSSVLKGDDQGINREEYLEPNLSTSPLIYFDPEKGMSLCEPGKILDEISNYSKEKSIADLANTISIDYKLLRDNENFRKYIEQLPAAGGKNGITINAHLGDEGEQPPEVILPPDPNPDEKSKSKSESKSTSTKEKKDDNSIEKRNATYYILILIYSFLTKSSVANLGDVLTSLKEEGEYFDENKRIAKHIGLDVPLLEIFSKEVSPYIKRQLNERIREVHQLLNDNTLSEIEKATRAMKKFGRMSESEIVTPEKVADEMVAVLPKDAKNGKILDIASKQGEFAIALVDKFGDEVKDKIYAISTSPLAYEFTRKVFEIIGIPIKQIFSEFTSYDLLPSKETKDKKKKEQTRDQELINKLKKMKFKTIIGNPPYMEPSDVNKRQNPIYHYFYDTAEELSDMYVLISPGRFLVHAGLSNKQKEITDKMLNDEHVKIAHYYNNSKEVFPNNVDIKGGVAIILRDISKKYKPIGFFSVYPELETIRHKVITHKTFIKDGFPKIMSSQGLYKFTDKLFEDFPYASRLQGRGTGSKIASNNFNKLTEAFSETEPADKSGYLKILGLVKGKQIDEKDLTHKHKQSNNRRVVKWIASKYVQETDSLNFYKVFITAANGTGDLGEELSTPLIGEPKMGHTDTFLSIGKFNTKDEAEACLKYIKTKFVRAMWGLLKVTQNGPKYTWANVPLQDFTSKSDINWSKSVEEIDQKLYKKYKLTEDEIAFIERMIKPMSDKNEEEATTVN